MPVFGTLAVNVVANTQKLQTGLKGAQRQVRTFSKSITKLGANVTKAFSAITAIGTTVSFAVVAQNLRTTAQEIDRIAKAARNLNITTEAFAALEHGAELSGLSIGGLESGLKRFTRVLNDARNGLKSAQRPLERLGINADQLQQLRLQDQLAIIAERFKGLTNESEKAALRMEIFGRAGADFGQLLEGGAKGIRNFQAEAERLGLTFSDEEARKVEQFNDAMTRLRNTLGGEFRAFVIDIAPGLERAVDRIRDTIEGVRALIEGIRGRVGGRRIPGLEGLQRARETAGRTGRRLGEFFVPTQPGGPITAEERARGREQIAELSQLRQERLQREQLQVQKQQFQLERDRRDRERVFGITP